MCRDSSSREYMCVVHGCEVGGIKCACEARCESFGVVWCDDLDHYPVVSYHFGEEGCVCRRGKKLSWKCGFINIKKRRNLKIDFGAKKKKMLLKTKRSQISTHKRQSGRRPSLP